MVELAPEMNPSIFNLHLRDNQTLLLMSTFRHQWSPSPAISSLSFDINRLIANFNTNPSDNTNRGVMAQSHLNRTRNYFEVKFGDIDILEGVYLGVVHQDTDFTKSVFDNKFWGIQPFL